VKRISLLLAVAALLVPIAASASTARGGSKICGQKHGPYTAWTDVTPFGKFHYKGSTWTIFASGVTCSRAMAMAPAMLRKRFAGFSGWRCGVLPGRIFCFVPTLNFAAGKAVNAYMYAPLTLAEIKEAYG